jgi:hypothetical protein
MGSTWVGTNVADPDPHQSGNTYPDPHIFYEKPDLDPHPHQSEKPDLDLPPQSETSDPDPHQSEKSDPECDADPQHLLVTI